jgi:ABC-type sugar transport system ATPase subunit
MIRIEGLHVAAGGFSLHIDDLSLESGEFLVILGPTGSGKTVLLETVAGLRRPKAGQVRFGGKDVTMEPPERRRVGFVYQDYALFPHLTVAENIAFGLRGRGTRGRDGRAGSGPDRTDRRTHARDRVAALASLLGIGPLLLRYPAGLSGGEQQRVALARALAIEPDILLLDEPLSALDRQTRRELRGEIKRLHRESGTTVLHVTHDLDEALALGDRMAVLIDGELRQVGVPAEVMRRPVDAGVAELLGTTNVFPVAGSSIESGHVRVKLVGRAGDTRAGEVQIVAESAHVGPLGGSSVAVIRPEEILLEGPGEALGDHVPESGPSAANLLEGTVRNIQIQSVHASIEVDVPPVFVVHVLRPDVHRLGLAVGSPVRLWIPPAAVHICREPTSSGKGPRPD